MTPEQETRIREAVQRCTLGAISVSDITALLAEADRLRDVSVKNIRTLEWTARRLKEHGLSTCELEEAIGQTAAALSTEPNGESNG